MTLFVNSHPGMNAVFIGFYGIFNASPLLFSRAAAVEE
ncbi:hypothetical protein ACVWZ4_001056 [Bradyrhizobium sp. USDA 4472]